MRCKILGATLRSFPPAIFPQVNFESFWSCTELIDSLCPRFRYSSHWTLHDSIKLVSAGILSDVAIMPPNSSPISESNAITLPHIHSPVDVRAGNNVRHPLSLATRSASVLPFFSSVMNIQSKKISGTSSSPVLVLRQSSSL